MRQGLADADSIENRTESGIVMAELFVELEALKSALFPSLTPKGPFVLVSKDTMLAASILMEIDVCLCFPTTPHTSLPRLDWR